VHAAPPVRVSIGRSAGWTAFVAAAGAAAAANLVAWLWLHAHGSGAAVAAAFAGALAAAVCGTWAQRRARPGDLAWDGALWWWREVAGEAHVALDFDGWLLLRFSPVQGRREWIAVSRSTTAGPWAALRAALYSRRPADPVDAPPA
jgi:hypothetical protein